MEKCREKIKKDGEKGKRRTERKRERDETEGNEGWDCRRDGFRRTWELSTKRAVKRSLESTRTVYTIVSAANGRTINVARICDWISVKWR